MSGPNPYESPQPSEWEIPSDWKERLLAILTREGITQPPHRSGYLSWCLAFAKVFGLLILAAAGCFIPVAILLELKVSDEIVLGLVGAFFIISLFFMSPWIARLGIEARGDMLGRNPTYLLKRAKRPPVLYLRSFGVDQLMATALNNPVDWDKKRNLEREANNEVNLVGCISWYACVLAIGKPGEPAPPSGAARFYVPHDQWQRAVAEIAPLCRLVVWTTGHTEGLDWEIRHIVENLPPRRLLLWLHVQLSNATPAERRGRWEQFLSAYQGVFPKPLPQDVEETQFLAFHDDWTPEPIPGPRYRSSSLVRKLYWPHLLHLNRFLKERL